MVYGILLSFIAWAVVGMFSYCKPKKRTVPYTSNYSVAEHEERLTKITENKFAYLIETGQLADIRAEIVYAIDDDPEYFLITLEFAEEFEGGRLDEVSYTTKYMHTIGVIKNDEYIMGLREYDGKRREFGGDGNEYEIETWWREGRSLYDIVPLRYSKKYYGNGYIMVKTNDGIIKFSWIHNGFYRLTQEFGEGELKQYAISPEKYESYNEYYIREEKSYAHTPLGYKILPNSADDYNVATPVFRFLKDKGF